MAKLTIDVVSALHGAVAGRSDSLSPPPTGGMQTLRCGEVPIRTRRVGMSKAIPSVQKYMTTTPHSIGAEQVVSRASDVMREHDIRHLPVLHGGKLLGIVTDRDIRLIESLRDVDPTKLLVEEATTGEPYTVTPETPLDQVVKTMADKKYGSAVVVQNNKVVGIFTTVDACKALAELLNTRLHK